MEKAISWSKNWSPPKTKNYHSITQLAFHIKLWFWKPESSDVGHKIIYIVYEMTFLLTSEQSTQITGPDALQPWPRLLKGDVYMTIIGNDR